MPITYSLKIEKKTDGKYLVGLRGENDDGKVTHVWKPYATKPDKAMVKADFKARRMDEGTPAIEAKDATETKPAVEAVAAIPPAPIVGSSLKEQLDKWFTDRDADVAAADETPADPSITFP